MKKLVYSAALVSALLLAACGDDATSIKDTDSNSNTTKTSEEAKTTAPAEKADKSAEKEETDSSVDEDENMRAENTYTNKELGISGEAGPMKYNISAVQLKKITVKSEEAASLFEVEIGDEVHGITIAMDGENTSDEDMTFYLSQATIITNTKEQIEPDVWFSEYIESEYMGQVTQEGYNFYRLKKSTVDQLESIEIRISAPMNSNYDTVGEDIKHVIEVNK